MNQHYKEAERLSAESSLIHEWPAAERAAQAGRGQIEATLALAYEQRTANLIAALEQVSPQDYAWLREARDNPESDKGKQLARWDAIGRQIEERLELA